MSRSQLITILSQFVLFLSFDVLANDTTTEPDESRAAREKAIARAEEIGGFGELPGYIRPDPASQHITLRRAIDTLTPYLAEAISGRWVWQIEFTEVHWNPVDEEAAPESIQNSFEMQVDAETGQVLTVRSIYKGSPEERPCEARWDIATEQMQNIALEQYVGFPDSNPAITFVEALNAVTLPPPSRAKLIVANYVLYTRGSEVRPVWAIHLYGTPEIKHGITSMRTIVDAETGEKLRAINIPYSDCENDNGSNR